MDNFPKLNYFELQKCAHKYYKHLINSIWTACHRLIENRIRSLDRKVEYFEDDVKEIVTRIKLAAFKEVSLKGLKSHFLYRSRDFTKK